MAEAANAEMYCKTKTTNQIKPGGKLESSS